MVIKNFKQFESTGHEEEFPQLQEVKEYFYDFTDELNTHIDDYDYGYLYFFRSHMIDILKTNASNRRLEYDAEFIRLNREKNLYADLIKVIQRRKVPAYDFLSIHFEHSLFESSKLPILIDCLKSFYSHTQFRPIKSLWTEDYVDDFGNVVTKYGFEGTFVRVSDDEYKKMCQIFQQGNFTTTLTKLFQ